MHFFTLVSLPIALILPIVALKPTTARRPPPSRENTWRNQMVYTRLPVRGR